MAHSDDVILPKTQLVIIVPLKVKQGLGPSPPVARHHEEVFMVSLVAFHGVVRSQVLREHDGMSSPGKVKVDQPLLSNECFY